MDAVSLALAVALVGAQAQEMIASGWRPEWVIKLLVLRETNGIPNDFLRDAEARELGSF